MMPLDLDTLSAQVKQHDNDRYICALFAPEPKREGLFALYAFNYEIAKIRETVTEPMIGLIRLAWWREAIEALYAGDVGNHTVLQGLHQIMQHTPLSKTLFDAILDGRENDLEETPPATLEALESYAISTSSFLFQLALEVLEVPGSEAQQAARHVGIAWMLLGYLRAIRFYSSSKRVLFPQDMLEQAGITSADIIAGRTLEETAPMVQQLILRAEEHLASARKLRPHIPAEALPALLPAVIATLFIRRIKKSHTHLFHTDLEQNRLWVQLEVLFNAWRGRF